MERRSPGGGRQKDALTIVREIRGTPEEIFRALSDPEEIMKWWGPRGGLTRAHVNLRPGGEYRFELEGPGEKTGWVKGQYQIVEPPTRIVKTWFSSKFPDLRNSVEFRLEPTPGGTRLTLVHGGLAGRPEAFADYEKSWKETLESLAGSIG
jgi:uncharacterized protein YndB with AHSA1/START domain